MTASTNFRKGRVYMRWLSKSLFAPALFVLQVLALPLVGAAQTYTVTDLGTLGGTVSGAQAINAAGQITGYSFIAGGAAVTHAFLYSDGSMADLGTLGGNVGEGNGINSSGQVAGYATSATPAYRAFLYSDGTMNDWGVARPWRTPSTTQEKWWARPGLRAVRCIPFCTATAK
jgi:probable HAF family extracellular repeat protein